MLQEDARLVFLYEVASLCHHSYQSDPYELERLAFSCHGLWTLAHRDGCHAGLHVEEDEDEVSGHSSSSRIGKEAGAERDGVQKKGDVEKRKAEDTNGTVGESKGDKRSKMPLDEDTDQHGGRSGQSISEDEKMPRAAEEDGAASSPVIAQDVVNTCGVDFADPKIALPPSAHPVITQSSDAAAVKDAVELQPTINSDDSNPAKTAPNPSGGLPPTAAASGAANTVADAGTAAGAKSGAGTKRSVKAPLPTFVVLARNKPQKIAFVVVRGTQSLSDCLIDAQAMPRPLYLPKAPKPHGHNDGEGNGGDSASKNANPPTEDRKNDGDTSKLKSVRYWVHGGMARAAAWVEAEIGPLLLQLAAEHYRIVVCGHSLGGGVATLLHTRLTSKHASLAHVECVGMGTPPMVDPILGQRTRQASFHAPRNTSSSNSSASGSSGGSGSGGGTEGVNDSESARAKALDLDESSATWLSNAYAGTVTSVVNRDDLICRAAAANARLLVGDLKGGDAHWQGSFAADKQVFICVGYDVIGGGVVVVSIV